MYIDITLNIKYIILLIVLCIIHFDMKLFLILKL